MSCGAPARPAGVFCSPDFARWRFRQCGSRNRSTEFRQFPGSNFPVIHAKGSQQLAVVRQDRLDQAARSPAATAESLNFTHFGSERMSATKTGCRR